MITKVFSYVAADVRVIRISFQCFLQQTLSLFVFLIGSKLHGQHGLQNSIIGVELQGKVKLFDGWRLLSFL